MPAKYDPETWVAMVFSKLHANSVLACWEWTGGKTSDGYGAIRFREHGTKVHRALFIYLYGELPPETCVLHRCDNRSCCNPFHLFTGTQSDNINDAVLKGRQPRAAGEKQWQHILTADDVMKMRQIRKESGLKYSAIAEQFGVATITAAQAIIGHSWAHLPGAVQRKQYRPRT